MTDLFANPTVRLIGRAILAGVLAFAAQVQASDNTSGAVLRSAIVAGVLAIVEFFTPLNALVGFGKPVKKKTA